jgi:hypothetical protein
MNSKKMKVIKLKVVRYYLITGIFESLAAIVFLLIIPADSKSIWIFGFSKIRLGMTALLFLAVLIFMWLSIITWRNQNQIAKAIRIVSSFLQNYQDFFQVWVISFGVIVFGSYIYLYLNTTNLTTTRGIILRLSPFIFLAFTRTVQTLIVFYQAGFNKRERAFASQLGNNRSIVLNPNRVALILGTLAGIFVLTTVSSDVIARTTWDINFGSELNLFHENNLPTFFSSVILVIAALLFALIAKLKRSDDQATFRGLWISLAIIFVYLGVDEAAGLHEKIGDFVQTIIDPGGIFYFTWVIPGIIFVIIFSFSFFRFFLHFSKYFRRNFFLSACFYVGGALGLEVFEGWYKDTYGVRNEFNFFKPTYQVVTTI